MAKSSHTEYNWNIRPLHFCLPPNKGCFRPAINSAGTYKSDWTAPSLTIDQDFFLYFYFHFFPFLLCTRALTGTSRIKINDNRRALYMEQEIPVLCTVNRDAQAIKQSQDCAAPLCLHAGSGSIKALHSTWSHCLMKLLTTVEKGFSGIRNHKATSGKLAFLPWQRSKNWNSEPWMVLQNHRVRPHQAIHLPYNSWPEGTEICQWKQNTEDWAKTRKVQVCEQPPSVSESSTAAERQRERVMPSETE